VAERFLIRLVERVVARPRTFLGAFALAVALAAPGVARLATDNSPPVWFLSGSPEVAAYRSFVARFGADEGYRIALEGPGVWTPAGLAWLERLEDEVRSLTGVVDVSSIVRHHRAEFGTFPPPDLEAFRAEVVGNVLDRNMGWVAAGPDPGRPALSLLIETRALAAEEVPRLERELARLTADPPPGIRVTTLGSRSVEGALDRSSRDVLATDFPLLVALAVVLLAATFRDAAGVVVPLAFVGASLLATLGALGWAGGRLNLLLAVLAPLLFVIGLATALHVLIPCRAFESEGLEPARAVVAVYREKGRALVWTALTTAAGFAALAVSPVPPVRELGVWAGAGLLVQLAAALLAYPALLTLAAARRGLPERGLERRLERLGARCARFAVRRRPAVTGAAALLALGAALGLPRLERQSDALAYLEPEHPVRRAADHLEALGLGAWTLDLDLAAPAGSAGWRTPESVGRLADLAAALRAIPGVLGVVGPGDLVDDVAAASPFAALAGSPAELRQGALETLAGDPELARALDRFVTPDGRHARVTLFVRHGGYEAIGRISGAAAALAGRLLPPDTGIAPTGQLPVLLALHRALLATLGRSLGLMIAVLAVLFAFLLGSGRAVAAALVPALLPVLLVFGIMGWLGVPLDVATVMVASIVVGLAVDDTIHLLAGSRARAAEVGERAAVAERIERTSPALLLTGGILVAGFAVCGRSGFAPVARFGLLSALAIALAVAAALLLLPALFARGRG
jgi:predicted RND superfamily exporter protein